MVFSLKKKNLNCRGPYMLSEYLMGCNNEPVRKLDSMNMDLGPWYEQDAEIDSKAKLLPYTMDLHPCIHP